MKLALYAALAVVCMAGGQLATIEAMQLVPLPSEAGGSVQFIGMNSSIVSNDPNVGPVDEMAPPRKVEIPFVVNIEKVNSVTTKTPTTTRNGEVLETKESLGVVVSKPGQPVRIYAANSTTTTTRPPAKNSSNQIQLNASLIFISIMISLGFALKAYN